jgi:hypothetical protein
MTCGVQWSERKEGPDERGPGVSGVREGREYPFGVKRYWAMGSIQSWAKSVPLALLSFSISFLLFYFLISYFFVSIFC